MAIQEKRVTQALSISAMIASTVITGFIWYKGLEEPRKYVSNMAINHHATYGSALDCAECHTPVPGTFGLMTAMGCSTAECHGELLPDTPRDVAFAAAKELFVQYGDPEERAAFYLAMHEAAREESCWTCHTEHTLRPKQVMDGWVTYNQMLHQNMDVGPNEKRLIGAWLNEFVRNGN